MDFYTYVSLKKRSMVSREKTFFFLFLLQDQISFPGESDVELTSEKLVGVSLGRIIQLCGTHNT